MARRAYRRMCASSTRAAVKRVALQLISQMAQWKGLVERIRGERRAVQVRTGE